MQWLDRLLFLMLICVLCLLLELMATCWTRHQLPCVGLFYNVAAVIVIWDRLHKTGIYCSFADVFYGFVYLACFSIFFFFFSAVGVCVQSSIDGFPLAHCMCDRGYNVKVHIPARVHNSPNGVSVTALGTHVHTHPMRKMRLA